MIHPITTRQAPQAIGPYSQAILAHNFLFVSGQIPIDPETGRIVSGGIENQCERVFLNLEAILKAAGLTFSQVVKVEVYVQNLDHFPLINSIYEKWVSQPIQPARQLMQVARLPLDSLIEISCIAVK